MARTLAQLPAGSRVTDYISLGVIAQFCPAEQIHQVLAQTHRASVRERDLPAHVVVYYVIALALYVRSSYRAVLRCLLAGVQWLLNPSARVRVVGKSSISQARSRLGAEPLQRLYSARVVPIAESRTTGAWYRHWRLVSLDGSTLDVADTEENGRPAGVRAPVAVPVTHHVKFPLRCHLKLPPPAQQEEMRTMADEQEEVVSPTTELRSAEESMLGAELVREMVVHRERGEGVKRIARELGVDRKTVKRWCDWGPGNHGSARGGRASSTASPS